MAAKRKTGSTRTTGKSKTAAAKAKGTSSTKRRRMAPAVK